VKLTTHLQPVPRSRKFGFIYPLPYAFMACKTFRTVFIICYRIWSIFAAIKIFVKSSISLILGYLLAYELGDENSVGPRIYF
jgi:hypothetical protein